MKRLTPILVGLTLSLSLLLSPSAYAGGYVGDYALGDTVYCKFGTVRPSTGASFTLAGSPVVSAYPDNSTTQITAGITLTADFDGVTGMNNLAVVASGGNGYAAGTFYSLQITTGTVDSVSVTGQEACSFTIRKGTISGIPAATAGAAGGLLIAGTNADFDVTANATFAGGVTITQSTSNAAGLVVTGNGTGNGATITSGSGATGNALSLVAASTNGNGLSAAGVGTGAGQVNTGGATGAGASYVGGATSGNPIATTVTNPIGPVPMLGIDESGTMQSATATTAVLRSATSFPDNTLIGATLEIIGGTGIGQRCAISAWTSSSDTATCPTWTTTPDSTSDYVIWGTAAGSGATAADVWAYSTRRLTELDEDNTTIDINGTTLGTATSVGTVNAFANNSMTAAAAAADLTTELQSGLATSAALTTHDAKLGTIANLGSGATVAANLTDIEGQTDDIGTAGVGLTAVGTIVRDVVVEDQGSISLGCSIATLLGVLAGDSATSGGNTTFEEHTGTETRLTSVIVSAGNRTVTITCPSY